VRRIIHAIESENAKLRRATPAPRRFPSDEAATQLLFLVLRQVARTWKTPPRQWRQAKTQFAVTFDERFAKA
jgi:putative transposase